MPYINPDDREHFDNAINLLCNRLGQRGWNVGDLNYVFTRILKRGVANMGRCYATLNALMGVLECVKQEFYRRDVVSYEEKKIEMHGDVL